MAARGRWPGLHHQTSTLRPNDPQLSANNTELVPSITQGLVAKRLARRAMADIEGVVKPQPVMPTARADAQIASLAVDVAVVQAAVRKRLETNHFKRPWRRCTTSGSLGKRCVPRQVRRVGRWRGR